jgi:hypothetical protein
LYLLSGGRSRQDTLQGCGQRIEIDEANTRSSRFHKTLQGCGQRIEIDEANTRSSRFHKTQQGSGQRIEIDEANTRSSRFHKTQQGSGQRIDIDEVMRQQDKPLPDIGTGYSKNVSAETFSTESIAGPITDEPAIVETATFEQKRADALTAIVEHYVASATKLSDASGTTLKSLAGHERTQVVLHLNVETLKHAHCCEHNTMNKGVDSATCQHHTPPHLDNQWISLENARALAVTLAC